MGDAKMTSPSGSFTTYTAAAAYSEATKAAAAAVAEVTKERDEALAKYAFMVERAADTKLDGYRELASKLEQAEARVAELEALLGALWSEICSVFAYVPERQMCARVSAAIAPQEKKEVPRG